MKIISFLNFKGGVGKTTSTQSIGAALNKLEKKVLLIDLDPQGTLTFLSCEDKIKNSAKEMLFHEAPINECILKLNEFHIVQSNIKLSISEMELNSHYGKEFKLKQALENLEEKYDYILIDCPPSLLIFTLNALTASTDLIIPCECELASLEGLDLLLATLKSPIKSLNPNLRILGILPTKLDNRKSVSKEAYEVLSEDYGNTLPAIGINSKLSELGIEKDSIFIYSPSSKGAKDYMKATKEILKWLK